MLFFACGIKQVQGELQKDTISSIFGNILSKVIVLIVCTFNQASEVITAITDLLDGKRKNICFCL